MYQPLPSRIARNGERLWMFFPADFDATGDPGTPILDGWIWDDGSQHVDDAGNTMIFDMQGPDNIGFNVGLPSYDGWSQPYVDIGSYQSPYFDPVTETSSSVDLATGDHISGPVHHTIFNRGGDVLEAGTYDITWTGTGTYNSGASPATITISDATDSFDLNFDGQIQNLSIKKQGETGTYVPTFSTRANLAKCIRVMEAWRINEDGDLKANNAFYDPANPWVRIREATNRRFHKLLTAADWASIAHDHGSDLWICIHHRATNAHITQIANDINGTSFSGQLYVEHSNEVWNGDFPQHGYALTQANAVSPSYTGGDAHNRMAWHADRTNEIGGLIKAVIPSAVIVLGSSRAVPSYGFDDPTKSGLGLQLCKSDLANISAFTVAGYFGQTWVNATDNATILSGSFTNADIVSGVRNDWETVQIPLLQDWIVNAALQGWRLMAYEGGCHLFDADSATQAKLVSAANSTEMAVLYSEVFDWWNTNVNDLFCVFQDTGKPDNPWSHILGERVSPTPRWNEVVSRLTV